MFGLQFVNEVQNIQREMDQLFRQCGFEGGVAPGSSRVAFKVTDQGDAFQVEAALPGIDIEKLNIDVLGRKVTVAGEFKGNEQQEDLRWYRQERRSGAFEKSFFLPADLDTDKVVAEYQLGILKVELPKAAGALPKKIAVNVA